MRTKLEYLLFRFMWETYIDVQFKTAQISLVHSVYFYMETER
jgi:hypothetical protein